MAPYIQTNDAGYVVGVTNEELLSGLFGGKTFREVSDEEARAIQEVLENHHSRGMGLHLSELEKIKLSVERKK